MSHKTAEVAAVVLALAVLGSAAMAEAAELTDEQMDQVTAGAFNIVGDTQNLIDSTGVTYTFNAANTNYTSTNGGVWRPLVINYYQTTTLSLTGGGTTTFHLAIGVLVNDATGQTWDGGVTSPTGPLGPPTTFHFGAV